MELKNRRSKIESTGVERVERVHGRDGRMEERDDGTEGRRDAPHASMAQGAGGFRIQKLRFSDGILDPGWFRKVREACRKNFHLFSSKSDRRISSYDQKHSELHDY